MKTLIGLVLFVVGLLVVLYGLGSALLELGSLYQGALNDPLGNSSVSSGNEEPARVVGNHMWQYAIIGMIGIPPLLIGSTLLSLGFWSRIRKRFFP